MPISNQTYFLASFVIFYIVLALNNCSARPIDESLVPDAPASSAIGSNNFRPEGINIFRFETFASTVLWLLWRRSAQTVDAIDVIILQWKFVYLEPFESIYSVKPARKINFTHVVKESKNQNWINFEAQQGCSEIICQCQQFILEFIIVYCTQNFLTKTKYADRFLWIRLFSGLMFNFYNNVFHFIILPFAPR